MIYRCSCQWSMVAHAPNASPRAECRSTPPTMPRNRWQALRNRLNRASYADWPRLCWQAAIGHPL